MSDKTVSVNIGKDEAARLVTVYENPKDYPGKAVTREWIHILSDRLTQEAQAAGAFVGAFEGCENHRFLLGPAVVHETVQAAREYVERTSAGDFVWLGRNEKDDPCIADIALLGMRDVVAFQGVIEARL